MNVFIRTDASFQMGTGHIMRCMTLAKALRQCGVTVLFVSRELPGHLCDYVKKEGFSVCRLPYDAAMAGATTEDSDYACWLGKTSAEDVVETGVAITDSNLPVDWLVVDHYALDHNWERAMRPFVRKIMVIDDLANRNHDCELLLDQNLYENMKTRYNELVPPNTVKLLGPAFALLRSEFLDMRRNIKVRSGAIENILVYFGGSDLSNETVKSVEAIASNRSKGHTVDIVIGSNNSHGKAIAAAADKLRAALCHVNVKNMAKLMVEADLCIGAAGGTTWERCCLGLPTMVITVAENQVAATRCLHENNILYFIGEHSRVSAKDITKTLDMFCSNSDLVRQYSENSMLLVDGIGAQRCVDEMLVAGKMRKSKT